MNQAKCSTCESLLIQWRTGPISKLWNVKGCARCNVYYSWQQDGLFIHLHAKIGYETFTFNNEFEIILTKESGEKVDIKYFPFSFESIDQFVFFLKTHEVCQVGNQFFFAPIPCRVGNQTFFVTQKVRALRGSYETLRIIL